MKRLKEYSASRFCKCYSEIIQMYKEAARWIQTCHASPIHYYSFPNICSQFLPSLSFSLFSLHLSFSTSIFHTHDTITSFLVDYTTDNLYITYIYFFNKLVLRVFIRLILIFSQQELGYVFTLHINIKVQLTFKLLSTELGYYKLDAN